MALSRQSARLATATLLAAVGGCTSIEGLDGLHEIPLAPLEDSGGARVDGAPTDIDAGPVVDGAGAGDAPTDTGHGTLESGVKEGGAVAIRRVQVLAPGLVHLPSQSANGMVLAGDLLVVGAYWADGAATASVTDSLHNPWKSTPARVNPVVCFQTYGTVAQMWYAEGIQGGADTVTVSLTPADTAGLGLFVIEYSGVATSGALDGQGGEVAPAASNAVTTGSFVSSGAGDVVVGLFSDEKGGGTMLAGAGFTSRAVDTIAYAMIEDDLPLGATPGPQAATANLPMGATDDCWVATAAAFHGQ